MPAKKDEEKTRIAIAMISEQKAYTVANNLKELCRLAEKAGRMGCDLFATEENALTLFSGETVKAPGKETRALGAICREHKMYITLGARISEKAGVLRNATILLDRRGRVAGIYHKMQLINAEIRAGIVPGDEAMVFETDFGRIATAICYDAQFPETTRMMAVKGADLVLFPHVGGAVTGDMTSRTIAYDNTIWSASIGRGCCCVCDPRGNTVAKSKKMGELIVVDCALLRDTLSVNPGVGIARWRYHQWLERRPAAYDHFATPPLVIESEELPLYLSNPMTPGATVLDLVVVNRSSQQQQAELTLEAPARLRITTDEYVDWFIDQEFGETDWKPTPSSLKVDLKPGGRKRFKLRFRIPEDAVGYQLLRIGGTTASGWPVLWERQLFRAPTPPQCTVPKIKNREIPLSEWANLPLTANFMGGEAGSRTRVCVAHNGRELLIHAQCQRYGPWYDAEEYFEGALSALSVAREGLNISLNPESDLIFWLRLSRDGSQTTQRREKGVPVDRPSPKWHAEVEQGPRSWSAWVRIPLKSFGITPGNAPLPFNIQRAAPLPAKVDQRRALSKVVTGKHEIPAEERRGRSGVEWVAWSTHYSRIDNAAGMGSLLIQ